MAIEFMKSVHTIDDVTMTFSKLQPTKMDEYTTRKLTITRKDAKTVADAIEVEFTQDGFELLQAVLNQY